MGKVTVDFGEFEILNDGVVIPHITNEIERNGKYDILIKILPIPEFDSPDNWCRGGQALYPEAHLPHEKEYIVLINPHFKYTSVLAHELCHVLLAVKGFPRQVIIKDEKEKFGLFTKIGEIVTDYAHHKYINKHLSKLGMDSEEANEKYWQRLKTKPRNSGISRLETFLRGIYLLKTVIDLPKHKKVLLEYEQGLSEEITRTYSELKRAIKKGPTAVNTPAAMFKSIISIINIIDEYKEIEIDNIHLYEVNTLLPLFISEKNLEKPAGEYFHFWVFGAKKTNKPYTLKIIYQYGKLERLRISVGGRIIPQEDFDRAIPDYRKILSSSTVRAFLDWLILSNTVKEHQITFI